jgi:hypothetical protein
MGTQQLFNEKQWREFEMERWRAALRRGLHLRSLDLEHQQALFEAVRPVLRWQTTIALRYPNLVRPLRIAARVAAMAALITVGYVANYAGPAAAKWTRNAAVATVRQTCSLSYVEMSVGNSDPVALQDECTTGKAH